MGSVSVKPLNAWHERLKAKRLKRYRKLADGACKLYLGNIRIK